MGDVQGTSVPQFEPVRDALAHQLDTDVELGASIYVDVGGDPVLDIWGGWKDRAHIDPWVENTIANVWSTTKTVTALAVLTLVDRGAIDVYAPVATYWPEFAENGKERVEVRHILSHTSGISGWAQPFDHDDAYDFETAAAKLASQPPWWEPGSAAAYHASTYGHLNGELIRRVTGMGLGEFVASEIAGPIGADFHIGLDDADFRRCATIYPPAVNDMSASLPMEKAAGPDPDSLIARTLAGSLANIQAANTDPFRRAVLGATNGHGNARSVAQLLSAVTLGGRANGRKLLSPPTIDLIFDEQANGTDMFLAIPIRWGIGFALTPSGGVPFVRDGRVCFWGGWGGSMIIMDLERQLTIAYVMNQMQPGTIGSNVAAAYCDEIYRCFDRV